MNLGPSFTHIAIASFVLLTAGCSDEQTLDSTAPTGQAGSVDVTFETQSQTVNLGTLQTLEYKGLQMVRVSDVWNAAHSADPTTLAFSFESDDGFKPSDKECADLPGDVLDRGYIEPASRNLVWDESLGFRGCYSVKSTRSITGKAPEGDAGMPDATVVE